MDWVSEWFKLLEIMLDEKPVIPFACYHCEKNTIEWHELPHHEYDGFSGYTKLLTERGYDKTTFPVLKEYAVPALDKKIKAFINYYFHSIKKVKTDWRSYKPEKKLLKPAVEYIIFGNDDTFKIEKFCRKNNIMPTAFFLSTLNAAAVDLMNNSDFCMWMIPVNMRPLLKKSDDCKNQTAYLSAVINGRQNTIRIDRLIRDLFNTHFAWGSWWGLNIGKIIGKRGMRFFLNNIIKNELTWTGCLSNLGYWNPVHTDNDINLNEIWFGCPPVTRHQPIGAGLINWKGRLVLSLQIHPAIINNRSEIKKIISIWQKKITESLYSNC